MNDSSNTFTTEVRDDGVAIITMDVPGEPVNTLKDSFVEEFTQVFDALEASEAVKAVVFTSGKPKNFLAGADITMLEACQTAAEAADNPRSFAHETAGGAQTHGRQ